MSAPLVETHALTVELDGRTVLDGVTVSLSPGETVALLGPNGAGKTTLLRALLGLVPARGEIRFAGRAPDPATRARQIAYLPQGHAVAWPMPVAAVVGLGRTPFADALGRQSAADRAAVESALAATELTALADRPVDTLSGGERARVALARVLATGAPAILADEPTAALDPRHQIAVLDLLAAHAARGGAALAIVHDLAQARRFARRTVILRAGRIVADGPTGDILTAARVGDVFGVETRATGDGALVPWRLAAR